MVGREFECRARSMQIRCRGDNKVVGYEFESSTLTGGTCCGPSGDQCMGWRLQLRHNARPRNA